MKSVIEEGSSISKAIENGWVKAGKPKEFTVKIFQEPKKNFLGFTTIVAKVGIFFNEDYKDKAHSQRHPHRSNTQNRSHNYSKNVSSQGQKSEPSRANESTVTKPGSEQSSNDHRPNPHRNRHRPHNKFRKKPDDRQNKPKQ